MESENDLFVAVRPTMACKNPLRRSRTRHVPAGAAALFDHFESATFWRSAWLDDGELWFVLPGDFAPPSHFRSQALRR